MPPDIVYEERYCAYVDILGFGTLIKEDAAPTRIHGLLERIYTPRAGSDKMIAKSDFKAQSISDAVAISTIATDEGLLRIIYVLEELAETLLLSGYFIRGALVKGPLYHDHRMVFGKAFVDAYTLEKTVADFPRIVLPRIVFKDAKRVWAKGYREFVRQATDGPFYIHVLRFLDKLVMADTKATILSDHLANYALISDQIQRRLRQAVRGGPGCLNSFSASISG